MENKNCKMSLGLSNKIWGVKGIACIIVATNHFINLFPVGKNNVIIQLFSNGTYMVYVFLSLSFFLIGKKCLETEISYKKVIVKKYLELVCPILLMYLIVLFMQKNNLFILYPTAMKITGGGDAAINYESVNTLKEVFELALTKVLFVQESVLIFPLWMIHFVFMGHLFTMLVASLVRGVKTGTVVAVCMLICTIVYKCFSYEYILCPLIVLITHFYVEKKEINNVIAFLALVLGIVGGIPFPFSIQPWLYIFGAIMSLFGIVFCNMKIAFFENAVMVFLGKISFAVYLIHQSLTTSLCPFIFTIIFNLIDNTRVATLFTLLFYYIFLIAISFLWNRYVLKSCQCFSNYICNYFDSDQER